MDLWKRAEKEGVNRTEDRRVHSDAQGKGEYCGHREHWVLEQHAECEPQILTQVTHANSLSDSVPTCANPYGLPLWVVSIRQRPGDNTRDGIRMFEGR